MTWNMLGHDWAAHFLQEHIIQGNIRHAYLFTGPAGIGRRTLALHFAQAINCPTPLSAGQPCEVCSTCRRIAQMSHPDLSIIRAEQEGGKIKVDQVRELQRTLSLSPYEARYRIAVLLRFEEAHPSASNALLKTLEEPPPQVILILTAESAENLPPTIVSRCEVIRLGTLSLEGMSSGLREQWKLPPEQADQIAHLSGGRPGYAWLLTNQPERYEQRLTALEDLQRMLKSSRVERFAYADTLAKDKELARQTLLTWLTFWRDVLLHSAKAATPLTNPDQAAEIENLAAEMDLKSAHRSVAAVERTIRLLEKNVNARLAIEVLLLNLPR